MAIYPDFSTDIWVWEKQNRYYFTDINFIRNHGNFEHNIIGPKEAKKLLKRDQWVIKVMERLAKE